MLRLFIVRVISLCLAFAGIVAIGIGACAKAVSPDDFPDGGDTGCPQFDLTKDPMHCGSCANACPSGQVCSMSQCKAMCDSPLTKCTIDGGVQCLETKMDPLHCGSCVNVCKTADAGGMPPGTQNPEAGIPFDASTKGWDPGMPTCTAGACGITCPMGMTKCTDGICYDTQNHHEHCGDCTTACQPDTEWCNNGHCCAPGQMYCGSACTDVLTDNMNCGTCGNACSGMTPYCDNGTCVKGCVPTGQRALFNTLSQDTASGCWNTNMCPQDQWSWNGTGQSFVAQGQYVVCSGAATCVGHVGIGTYSSASNCQSTWDVFCDSTMVGTISSMNKTCVGSAMTNGCSVTFTPMSCTSIKLVAGSTGSGACCGQGQPDSMVVAVSAW